MVYVAPPGNTMNPNDPNCCAPDPWLRARVCDIADRIPTITFPFYSETKKCTIPEAVGSGSCSFDFEAPRDLLLNDLSVVVTNGDDDTNVPAFVTVDYCDTEYVSDVFVEDFGYCCPGKPMFLLGVREGKTVHITVTVPVLPVGADVNVEVTLSGYQGAGCCG